MGIFDFLSPDFTDHIQLPFFIAIVFLAVSTMLLIWLYGREKNWQRRWDKGIQKNSKHSVDIESSSAQEVCYALASKPEKVAEIMPGILLICGLLGTFIGLGISIDKASSVLHEASAGMGGMGNAMDDLLSMLEGLGTKFKASTWGIIGFLILRAYLSYFDADGKRLQWVSKKLQERLEARLKEESEKNERANSALLNMLERLGDRICKESQDNKDVLTKNHEQGMQAHRAAHDNSQELMEKVVQDMRGVFDVMGERLCKLSEVTNKELGLTNKQLGDLLKSNNGVKKSVDDLLEANRSHIEVLRESSENMQSSSGQMAEAAESIGGSSAKLGAVVDGFSNQVTNVLEDMNTNLTETINKMGTSFQGNMENVSETLSKATSGIECAVEGLSSKVDETMNSVNEATIEASKIQKETGIRFNQTSETLSNQILEMTELVKDLRGNIVDGLTAVSASNRNVVTLNKRYEGVSDIAEQNNKSMQELILLLKDSNSKSESLVHHLQGVGKGNDTLAALLKELGEKSDILRANLSSELKNNLVTFAKLKETDHQLMNEIGHRLAEKLTGIMTNQKTAEV